MFDDAVSFRKADEKDLNPIWDLFHANCITLQDEEILRRIHEMYVLEYQKRILGVLCGTYLEGRVNIVWIAIHPLYPENALREAMIQQFAGIFCRMPGDGLKRNPVWRWFVQWSREQPRILYLKSGKGHRWSSRLIKNPSFPYISS